jgi:hypothetical protein
MIIRQLPEVRGKCRIIFISRRRKPRPKPFEQKFEGIDPGRSRSEPTVKADFLLNSQSVRWFLLKDRFFVYNTRLSYEIYCR